MNSKNTEMLAWLAFTNRMDSMSDRLYHGLYKNVREWYHKAYPSDNLWLFINADATFYDVCDRLYCCGDVYDVLVGDSIIRERVFKYFSEYLSLDYDIIYYRWLYIG